MHVALLMDFLDTPEKRDRRLTHLPMGRFGEAVEVAKATLFCAYFTRCIFGHRTYRLFLAGSGYGRKQLHDGMNLDTASILLTHII